MDRAGRARRGHPHRARGRRALHALADQVATAARLLDAAALAEPRRLLDQALDEAAVHGGAVADDGAATPPAPMRLPAALAPEDVLALGRRGEQLAQHVSVLVRGALAAATEADADAAAALATLAALAAPPPEARLVAGIAPAPLPAADLVAGIAPARLPESVEAGLVAGIALRALPAAGAAAAAWWAALGNLQRRRQIEADPDAIGALEGIPAWARHEANMVVLMRELAATEAELAGLRERERAWRARPAPPGRSPFRASISRLRRRLAMLASVRDNVTGGPGRLLLLLDTALPGRAAIALGPVDTAEHVAVVVPGLEQDVAGDLDTTVADALRLRHAAGQYAAAVGDTGGSATVAWLGYHTPSLATVASDRAAVRGAAQLRATLEGLQAARAMAADPSVRPLHLTLVGHSYGSVTSGIAVRRTTPVDDLVLIGSPGVGADHAGELRVPAGHVFVGEARGDPVADLAHFGRDPSSRWFGARQFQTDGWRVDPLTGDHLVASTGHSGYYDRSSESVRNIALITLGRPDLVSYGDMSGIGDVLLAEQGLRP